MGTSYFSPASLDIVLQWDHMLVFRVEGQASATEGSQALEMSRGPERHKVTQLLHGYSSVHLDKLSHCGGRGMLGSIPTHKQQGDIQG